MLQSLAWWFVSLTFMTFAFERSQALPQYADMHDGQMYDGYLSDWSDSADFRMSNPKCVDIPSNLTLCGNIGYKQMRLPNLLEHDSLGEVVDQAKSWVPLTGISCHPNTKLFLCSLFSPVCLGRPIYPCRSLCEAVKRGCEGRMARYGYPWPEMLRCDKFPLDNDLCIQEQLGSQPHARQEEEACEPCDQIETTANIVDNYCSSDFVMKVQIRSLVLSGGDYKIEIDKKKKVYRRENLKKRDVKSPILYLRNGVNCKCDKASAGNSVLVMGHKVGDRLIVDFLMPYSKRSSELKGALRAVKNRQNICKGDIAALETGMEEMSKGDKDDNKKSKDKRKKDRRNKPEKERPRKERPDKKDRKRNRRVRDRSYMQF